MKILTETGEEFPIYDDFVTCHFNFRRRPVSLLAYIRNYEFKFNPLTFLKYGSKNLIIQGSFVPKRQWFRFSGVQINIQVPIWPGFRRCSSLHSAIHPKGGEIFQTGGNEWHPTILKAGSKAIKEGATVKDVIMSTLKPTVGAVLGATVD